MGVINVQEFVMQKLASQFFKTAFLVNKIYNTFTNVKKMVCKQYKFSKYALLRFFGEDCAKTLF